MHLSVWAIIPAAACVATSVLLRIVLGLGGPPPDTYPTWLPAAQVVLAGWWLIFAVAGCVCRIRGYLRCRPAAKSFSLDPWVVASTAGAGLTIAGVIAVAPTLIGRPVLVLPAAGVALVLIGLVTGLVGMAVEFAFLTVLHRVLWDSAGWQVAAQTERYTVAFISGVVVAIGSVCLGALAVILTAGVNAETSAEPIREIPLQAKVAASVVLVMLCGCGGWLTWRYARLMAVARKSLGRTEQQPDTPAVRHPS